MNRVQGFIQRRRSLREEFHRILAVQMQAEYLMEELRRRRDGEAPQHLELPTLRAAINEVERL